MSDDRLTRGQVISALLWGVVVAATGAFILPYFVDFIVEWATL